MAMYKRDKNYRLNVRLSSYQYSFIQRLQGDDKSISEVFRMIIDSYMSGVKFGENKQIYFDDKL